MPSATRAGKLLALGATLALASTGCQVGADLTRAGTTDLTRAGTTDLTRAGTTNLARAGTTDLTGGQGLSATTPLTPPSKVVHDGGIVFAAQRALRFLPGGKCRERLPRASAVPEPPGHH